MPVELPACTAVGTSTLMEACRRGRHLKRLSFGISGGIIALRVEGMCAVCAVSLEMLGGTQWGKSNRSRDGDAYVSPDYCFLLCISSPRKLFLKSGRALSR